MTPITFFAAGKPETKGSARAFVIGGRARITNDNPRAKSWAGVISTAASAAYSGELLDGPLRIEIVFLLSRPKSHFTKKGLRPTAPEYCDRKPDIDKLARCALDALTGVIFTDDARVVRLSSSKRYAESATGAEFTITAGG